MIEIKDYLTQLGLSDYEASVYQVLVHNSPSGASFIAKQCNLSRSSVYTTLNTLISKGLVATTFKNEVKQFVAEDLSILQDKLKTDKQVLENKFKIYKQIEQELRNKPKNNLNVPNILAFEGLSGLKKIYLTMLRDAPPNSTLYLIRDEFVWSKDWEFINKMEWEDVAKRLKQSKNINTKLIINNSKLEKSKVSFYKSRKHVEFKHLQGESLQNFAIYILGDMVSTLSLQNNNLVGVKITNQNIANNYRALFNNLWKKQ